jgi:hypothetical protein
MSRTIPLWLALTTVLPAGCGSCLGLGDDDEAKAKSDDDDGAKKKKKKSDDDEDEAPKKPERPAACVRAEACCEEMAEFRMQDAGLVCTGVYAEKSGAKCNEFKKGYAGVFEASDEPLPEACQ